MSSLRPATSSPSPFSNWRWATTDGLSRSTWTDSWVGVIRLFLHVRFKAFLDDSRVQLFHRHLLSVEGDRQQIMVPFVADQLNAGKPYQGLFDPIGSIFSHQGQSLAHVGDMERHSFGAGRRRCFGCDFRHFRFDFCDDGTRRFRFWR